MFIISMLKAWLKAGVFRKESKKLLRKMLIRFSSFNYIHFYTKLMDSLVSDNPYTAVTSIGWKEGGYRQFLFLKHSGLKPSQKFLDLGCGTLSLGNYLIEYLDSSNYFGMDISAQALIKGRELVERRIGREKLEEKQPILVQNKDLTFSEVAGQVFDYVWAFSVFDHLPFKYFEEFISNIGNVTDHDSKIFSVVMLKEKKEVAASIPYLYSFSYYNPRCEYNCDSLRKLLLLNNYTMRIIGTHKHWGDLLKSLVLLELSHR